MLKVLTVATLGLVAAVSLSATGASAASKSTSTTVFTTPDGRRCVATTQRVRNDFGDVQVRNVRRCSDPFDAFEDGFGRGRGRVVRVPF
jgi:hypothetical protein